MRKGRCPKLNSEWVGPSQILDRLGEVVYGVQVPVRGKKFDLHRLQGQVRSAEIEALTLL